MLFDWNVVQKYIEVLDKNFEHDIRVCVEYICYVVDPN